MKEQRRATSEKSLDHKARAPVYDRLASHYDGAMQPLERWFLAGLRAKTLDALPEASRILEIGAGTGANFPYYPLDASGAASELSGKMLEVARTKRKPDSIHLIQNSAEALPYADASFDAAVATLVFCSVPSPQTAFAELRRVVRPLGTIALLEHVRPEKFLLGPVFDALNLFTVALLDDHFNRRTALEAQRAGLKIQRIERHALSIIQIIVCQR